LHKNKAKKIIEKFQDSLKLAQRDKKMS
jgi:hypothetical protein